MASKADRFYFENFIEASEYSCRAAEFLSKLLKEYKHDELDASLAEVHAIEHSGDIKKHEMTAALAKAFVTPVDREDLALISSNIDEVTDSIEEIVQRFYVDGIREVLPEAVIFADKLVVCCEMMKDMLREFSNFKKSGKLHDMIVALNHAEEECDALYIQSTKSVREQCKDVFNVFYWREIYDCMEKCADACEHVGDCVEMVVMKNT